ncbi:MAG: hypothetical protein A3C50_01400 [Candidatus Staskawiczbacteria bacterium RIFCSPHIGHO2_02_FULL_43_16]|uniref:Fido domain-containing protein n=1 Tax=Candidatus Staskawiczbacteria bacterium RIFCSPHIGHO2_01_FULL_41_41 TaxID=1802203 RepID=A0A1G2HS30_9BACT|nr:MAG: hypothetical protein A2822_02400 [Candidatus Staskawiczbacteria bacterium RIFCSPHIGHO2_01_FULL_41_41]OGZ69039.1 MAG: hypothetical protein A3C50_01400 [Candidatus Staskawiczbacteria bacterium RIFCSPHIGHO2_02_FULL_43_16]OGZ74532.1 MAG: hypothetical protein A3A12_02095 [Candidatus Staskawiczbacteria bacterium RIFCSPLOWO2_01_FULL_43_17b]
MEKEIKKGEIIIYQSADKKVRIDVNLDQDTVWLTQDRMAELFGKGRSTIAEHILNVFKERELDKNSVCRDFRRTGKDGKEYEVQHYNLDVIISVGYRVKSLQGTKFRIWATNTLKNYLVKGYAINEKRLLEANSKFNELQEAIDFLRKKSKYDLLAGQEQEILDLLSSYSKTLTLLEQYDKEKVALVKNGKGKFILTYEDVLKVINALKNELVTKEEAGEFFGIENSDKLKGIVGNLYQTFDKKELYFSIEEKAAHLLYFIIKDHPLVDGNKRTGAFLFVYFLDRNNYLYKESGERKINDNALTALALLIAVSDRQEKDKLVKIVTNLLKG